MFRFVLASLAWMGVCLGQAPDAPQERDKLIEEIETLASAEPPLLGIDTQIETAKVLMAAKRTEGRRFLDDALNRIRSISDARSVRELLYPAVELLLKDSPDEANLLVAAHVVGVQGRKAVREDGLLLDSFATLLESRFPDLAAVCRVEFERINRLHPLDIALEVKKGSKRPNTEGLDLEARIALARKQREPLVRIEMLLEVMDAEETSARRRAALASEVLPETEKLPMDEDRLVSQSMLTRRLFEAGDRPGAALAAQMLEQTFIKMYDCETAACMAVTKEGSPGEAVRMFAEYLDENGITPADLGLTHRSLRVRMLLIELKKSLEERK